MVNITVVLHHNKNKLNKYELNSQNLSKTHHYKFLN